jgi:hypothetical protein
MCVCWCCHVWMNCSVVLVCVCIAQTVMAVTRYTDAHVCAQHARNAVRWLHTQHNGNTQVIVSMVINTSFENIDIHWWFHEFLMLRMHPLQPSIYMNATAAAATGRNNNTARVPLNTTTQLLLQLTRHSVLTLLLLLLLNPYQSLYLWTALLCDRDASSSVLVRTTSSASTVISAYTVQQLQCHTAVL